MVELGNQATFSFLNIGSTQFQERKRTRFSAFIKFTWMFVLALNVRRRCLWCHLLIYKPVQNENTFKVEMQENGVNRKIRGTGFMARRLLGYESNTLSPWQLSRPHYEIGTRGEHNFMYTELHSSTCFR